MTGMTGSIQNVVEDVTSLVTSQMPAGKDKIALSVRADPEQHVRWVAAAQQEDVSLSRWIQRACDFAAGADPAQHAAWLKAARHDERQLLVWIQRACNAAAGYVPAATPTPATTPQKPRRKGR